MFNMIEQLLTWSIIIGVLFGGLLITHGVYTLINKIKNK